MYREEKIAPANPEGLKTLTENKGMNVWVNCVGTNQTICNARMKTTCPAGCVTCGTGATITQCTSCDNANGFYLKGATCVLCKYEKI